MSTTHARMAPGWSQAARAMLVGGQSQFLPSAASSLSGVAPCTSGPSPASVSCTTHPPWLARSRDWLRTASFKRQAATLCHVAPRIRNARPLPHLNPAREREWVSTSTFQVCIQSSVCTHTPLALLLLASRPDRSYRVTTRPNPGSSFGPSSTIQSWAPQNTIG